MPRTFDAHVDWLLEEIRKEHTVDVSRDFAALARVKTAAATADEEFQSGAATATIELPFITVTASGPRHFSRTVSRQEWTEAERTVRQPDGKSMAAADSVERLAAPPRRVPISLALLNMLNWTTLIGAFIFGLAAVFVARVDLSFITFRGPFRTAGGQVTAVQRIQVSGDEGDPSSGTWVDETRYVFSVAGHDYAGVSYSNSARVGKGDGVTIEFDENDPARSRISGMRRAIWGWSSPRIIVLSILSIIGFGFTAGGLGLGRRRNALLRDGPLAAGTLIAARPTDEKLDDPDYELTLEFTSRDAGRSEAKVRTNDLFLVGRLSREPLVPVLFDPGDRSRAYLLEAQPARPRLDEHGQLRGRTFAAATRLIQAVILLAVVWFVARTS